jgi:hypothetical protein
MRRMMMHKVGDKYCYVVEGEMLEEIVKRSYEAIKHQACIKAGFVPMELVERCDTGWVVRVPAISRVGNNGGYTWTVTEELLDNLEKIGDTSFSGMAVEMWRLKRSLEVLKHMTTPKKPQDVMIIKSDVMTKVDVAVPIVKAAKVVKVVPVTIPWPEVAAPKGIRVIKTYADGSQILDDGKERWLNADWTQPVKYVVS